MNIITGWVKILIIIYLIEQKYQVKIIEQEKKLFKYENGFILKNETNLEYSEILSDNFNKISKLLRNNQNIKLFKFIKSLSLVDLLNYPEFFQELYLLLIYNRVEDIFFFVKITLLSSR